MSEDYVFESTALFPFNASAATDKAGIVEMIVNVSFRLASWVIDACSRWGAGSVVAVPVGISDCRIRMRACISSACRFWRLYGWKASPMGLSPYVFAGGTSSILVGSDVIGLVGLWGGGGATGLVGSLVVAGFLLWEISVHRPGVWMAT